MKGPPICSCTRSKVEAVVEKPLSARRRAEAGRLQGEFDEAAMDAGRQERWEREYWNRGSVYIRELQWRKKRVA